MTNTCQYLGPDYDPQDMSNRLKPTPYCGCATLAGKSYCSEHYAIVYAKGSALRKRTKDRARAASLRQLESLFNEAIAELEAEGFDFDLKAVDEELV